MGMNLFYVGRALGLAMNAGRILVLAERSGDPTFVWYARTHCKGTRSWECWFQPVSNCMPWGDVETITPEEIRRLAWSGNVSRANRYSKVIPRAFWELLQCSPIKVGMWGYWWKAQSVTYIARFNAPTRKLLDALRGSHLRAQLGGSRAVRPAQFLPPGTIAMFVRHGDKALEMDLVPFREYLQAAERLVRGDQGVPVLDAPFADGGESFAFWPGHFVGRTMLVGSENQEVLDAALALAAPRPGGSSGEAGAAGTPPWDVLFCSANRTNGGVHERRRQFGVRQITLESFLILELMLEADAWVCTLSSNWCVLLDVLRMTIAAKASSPYVNLLQLGKRYRRSGGCPRGLPLCYAGW